MALATRNVLIKNKHKINRFCSIFPPKLHSKCFFSILTWFCFLNYKMIRRQLDQLKYILKSFARYTLVWESEYKATKVNWQYFLRRCSSLYSSYLFIMQFLTSSNFTSDGSVVKRTLSGNYTFPCILSIPYAQYPL